MGYRHHHLRAAYYLDNPLPLEKTQGASMNRYLAIAAALVLLLFFLSESSTAADGTMGDFRVLPHSYFRLHTNCGSVIRTSEQLKIVITNNRTDDDAAYPIYTANLDSFNDVSAALLAFSSICFDSINLMCLPYGFFEITFSKAATPVDIAIAMQLADPDGFILQPCKDIALSNARLMPNASYQAGPMVGRFPREANKIFKNHHFL
jgi:hypothetical protein